MKTSPLVLKIKLFFILIFQHQSACSQRQSERSRRLLKHISTTLNVTKNVRKLIIKPVNLIVLTFILSLISCTQNVIYMAVNGSDSNSGTKTQPVATVQKALEISRISAIKNIVITEGDYFDVSVIITESDSGLHISGQQGKSVRLMGGIIFGDWQQNGNWLEAQVPDSLWPELDFRILIVNDTLRDRARLPETGAFNHINEWPHQWQSSQGGWSVKPTHDDLSTLYYNPADLGPWLDSKNAELTVFHAWDDSYVGLAGIDTINHALRFSNQATHPAGAYASWAGEKTHQYIVWNIKEGMTRPGQWYVDRTNRKIVYWPFAYEKTELLEIMVPMQNHIFEIQDNSSGITLENLQLSCAGAPVSNTGYATVSITGAVLVGKVKNLVLKNVDVRNVAGWAVKTRGSNVKISDCKFSDTGAGGLYMTGEHITVERCGIHNVGKLYFGAVGIYGSGNRNFISHCELYNIPYCAINGIGKHSVAEYNLMYNFKQTMVDGGAIYMYGGDSTIYRNNAVLAPKGNKTEGWTYYFDELSVNCIMDNNLALNTIVPVHHHMADKITITNNLFIDEGHQKISYPLCSNLIFSGNIFVAEEILFSGPTGEKGATPKESLNAVFQKYFECNGIVQFEGNQMFADKVLHDVLHVYNFVRKENFSYNKGQQITDKDKRDNLRSKLPEAFLETGYRGNFKAVYEKMILGN